MRIYHVKVLLYGDGGPFRTLDWTWPYGCPIREMRDEIRIRMIEEGATEAHVSYIRPKRKAETIRRLYK